MPRKINQTDVVPYLSTFKGFYKKKTLKNKDDFNKLLNYFEKLKWTIEDFNEEFTLKEQWEHKDIVFVLTATAWIWDITKKITELYDPDILCEFEYKNKEIFESCNSYLRAIRSFTIAHPLGTTQCKKYGFDGDWICIDIRTSKSIDYFQFNNEYIYHLNINGLEHKYCKKDDIFLHAYSNKDGEYKYFRKIGMSSKDLIMITKIAIDKLVKLNTYLSQQK